MGGDFVLNVMILSIFIKKMRRIISDVDSTLSQATEQNVNLISNTVTKHSLLFGIAMIMNQAFYAVSFYGVIANAWRHTGFKDFVYSTRSLENIMNVTVLWLVLRANYNKYICLCGCCHKCIGKCCFKNMDSKAICDNPYIKLAAEDRQLMVEQSSGPSINGPSSMNRTISIN